MHENTARAVALDVLVWLCAREEELAVFLNASGATPDGLRDTLQGAPDDALLCAVMDFVLMRDATVLDAAQALDIAPERLGQAGAVLNGAGGAHWT